MPTHVLEWVRQFPNSRLVININDNGFVTLWNKVKSIDDMLDEREAQVRAEEREKVAGLVEALEMLCAWQTAWELTDNYLAMGPAFNNAKQALATYNDNRKG